MKPSKKAANKAKRKEAKLRWRQEQAATSGPAVAESSHVSPCQEEAAAAESLPDPLSSNYGDIPYEDLQSKEVTGRIWTKISSLDKELIDHTVLIRGRVHNIRENKNRTFIMVRRNACTVQCVLTETPDLVSTQMIKYATTITKESFVDIEGLVTLPLGQQPIIKSASQQEVEIQVRKIYCVNRAAPVLPLNIEDASRSEAEARVRVDQDTRLNHRFLDLRTPAKRGIYRLMSHVSNLFREFLLNEDFVEVWTPQIIFGASEGGASVFKLDYKNKPLCLAQSPQIHKQMLISSDAERVFVVGRVFRAEDSDTHRHLCEFTGLDVEMVINEHYSEVMDIVDRLFVKMFDELKTRCEEELKAIGKQYPFKTLKYSRPTLRLTFEEGIQMLQDAGVKVDPLGDLNTESEKALGKLVLEKYDTEFYILHRFPLAVRPFYTMPCYDNPAYSNSFDVFMRGEEIISGAQRVHNPEHLEKRAKDCEINVETLSTYINSFRCGVLPHGGFGAGLERIVMLFCALDNIRKVSTFPRDSTRFEP